MYFQSFFDAVFLKKISVLDLFTGVERKSGIPVTEEDVIALKDVIFELAGKANFHSEKARTIFPTLPRNSLPIYLPLVSSTEFLSRLRKVDFDIFHPKLRQRDGLLPLKLWWKLKTGRLYIYTFLQKIMSRVSNAGRFYCK